MASLKKRAWQSESGSVLIEAAITMPLLLLVVLGLVDFGRLFQRYEVVTNAAREGARVAILPEYDSTDAQHRVEQYITAGGLDPLLVTVTPITQSVPVGAGGPCITLRGVTVTYPHTYSFVGGIIQFFGGSGFGTINLTATASMRTEGAAGTCP